MKVKAEEIILKVYDFFLNEKLIIFILEQYNMTANKYNKYFFLN